MNRVCDRYISVSTYEEYNRLLRYWRDNLIDYEIIYTVDTEIETITEELFNDNILVAAWLHEEDKQLEIDILNLSTVYMNEGLERHLETLDIINSTDIV